MAPRLATKRSSGAAIAIALLVVPALCAGAECYHPQGNVLLAPFGDLNDSGTVNVADAICGLLVVGSIQTESGLPPCLAAPPLAADLNCDGVVEVADIVLSLYYALGSPLASEIDADGSGCPDACEPCVPPGQSSCLVQQGCAAAGETSPEDPCRACRPEVDAAGWSVVEDDAPCGGGKRCSDGSCVVVAPGAPFAVEVMAGSGEVQVSWSAPADTGGAPIDDYLVTVWSAAGGSPSGVTGPTTRAVGSSATSFLFTGLSNGVSYRFTVIALNEADSSLDSDPSAAVTPVGLPGAPGGVSATPGSASASVSFSAPSDDGGTPIVSFRVTATPGGAQTTGTVSPLVVSGLVNGTSYTFTVAATNAVGTGPESAPSSPVTPFGPPGAPTGVAAVAEGTSALIVSFSPPSSDGGSAVTSYTAQCTSSTGGATVSASGSSAPVTVSHASTGHTYTCAVRAHNAAGPGPWSTESAPTSLPSGDAGFGFYSGITYTQSSVYGGTQAATYSSMNDEVYSGTSGMGSNCDSPAWLQADLGSAKPVTRVRVAGGSLSSWGGVASYLNSATLAYSNNASSWTPVLTISGVSDGAPFYQDFTFPAVSARYWRLERSCWLATMEFRIGGQGEFSVTPMLWADAADTSRLNGGAISNGQYVETWQDKSPASRMGVAYSGGPTWYSAGLAGRPAIELDGARGISFAHDSALNSTTLTFAIVFSRPTASCWQLLFIKDSPGSWSTGFGLVNQTCSGTEDWKWWVNSYSLSSNGVSIGQMSSSPTVLVGTVSGGTMTIQRSDGVTQSASTNPYTTTNTHPFYIGGYSGAGARVGEVVLWNVALNETERAQVMSTLKARWGIP